MDNLPIIKEEEGYLVIDGKREVFFRTLREAKKYVENKKLNTVKSF